MPEILPPVTLDTLKDALKNRSFTVYAYIGKETDKGWHVAQAVFKLIPELRVYLMTSRALASEWTTDESVKAIVWGFGPKPKATLLKGESNDVLAVMDAITAARRGKP